MFWIIVQAIDLTENSPFIWFQYLIYSFPVSSIKQALEELAMNYDQKSQEVDSKNKENESLSEQLSEKLNSLNNIEVPRLY